MRVMHVLAAFFFLLLLIAGAIIVFAIFLTVWIPAIFILKIKRKWRATFYATPLVGLLYVTGIVGIFWYSTRPSVVFENTFGNPPPADVVDIKSELYTFADSGHVFMQFKCDRATIDLLIASQSMTIDPNPQIIWDEEPDWWLLGSARTWPECYRSEVNKKGFATEEAVLIYDLNTKQANYYWYGID